MNCFQNCIFTYDSQHSLALDNSEAGCELLSELYFYLWFPTRYEIAYLADTLWIAFRIVFLLMIPNMINLCQHTYFVVNCFQNCIFTYDSQPAVIARLGLTRCELLSELYFYLWFPTILIFISLQEMLWIAFRIVFLLMIPNRKWSFLLWS